MNWAAHKSNSFPAGRPLVGTSKNPSLQKCLYRFCWGFHSPILKNLGFWKSPKGFKSLKAEAFLEARLLPNPYFQIQFGSEGESEAESSARKLWMFQFLFVKPVQSPLNNASEFAAVVGARK